MPFKNVLSTELCGMFWCTGSPLQWTPTVLWDLQCHIMHGAPCRLVRLYDSPEKHLLLRAPSNTLIPEKWPPLYRRNGPIDIELVAGMAWWRTAHNPFLEPMITQFIWCHCLRWHVSYGAMCCHFINWIQKVVKHVLATNWLVRMGQEKCSSDLSLQFVQCYSKGLTLRQDAVGFNHALQLGPVVSLNRKQGLGCIYNIVIV